MKLLSRAGCLGLISLALIGCQSVGVPDIKSRLSALSNDSGSYIVRPGETLESIAFRYNMPVTALKQQNPEAANGVYSGMRLNIRGNSAVASQPARNARWSEPAPPQPQLPVAPGNVVETAPVQSLQAEPLVAPMPEQYRPEVQSYRNPVPEIAAPARHSGVTGYVQQPGYPVEEVVEDDNFILPSSNAAPDSANDYLVSEQSTGFVGGWQWPLGGQLARSYDPQRANGRAIEIVGMPGQQVYATRDGVVDWVARSPDGVGKVVIVRHDDDYLSIYSNTQDLYVSMRDTVRQGDPIASLGANANDEPLLRFEISKNGNLLNPMDFLSPR